MPNPDYKGLFIEALKKNTDNPKWNKGDFIGIKTVSNTKVGSVGQAFIESLCDTLSIPYNFPAKVNKERLMQSPWDIEIYGVKFELKTATEDTGGSFQFNHIRYHRPYDAVLCLGVTPNELHFGIWSKADVVTGKAGNLVSMEKGANASYKLTKKPSGLFPIAEFEQRMKRFTKNPNSSRRQPTKRGRLGRRGRGGGMPSRPSEFRRPRVARSRAEKLPFIFCFCARPIFSFRR